MLPFWLTLQQYVNERNTLRLNRESNTSVIGMNFKIQANVDSSPKKVFLFFRQSFLHLFGGKQSGNIHLFPIQEILDIRFEWHASAHELSKRSRRFPNCLHGLIFILRNNVPRKPFGWFGMPVKEKKFSKLFLVLSFCTVSGVSQFTYFISSL
jgi:hypothetical protein